MFNKRQPSGYGLDDTSTLGVDTTQSVSMLRQAAAAMAGTPQQIAAQMAPQGAALPIANSDGVVIIGKGTRIVGEITDCSRVEIQGTVEGTIVANALIIREGGSLTGRLQATQAEVHGAFNGQLDIADLLDIRATGTVEGELAYGKLAVSMGGHISGNVTNPRIEPAAQATAYTRADEADLSRIQSYP